MSKKNKVKKNKKTDSKIRFNLFSKYFAFEEGIDITDDVEVLKRRNVVIKNIIFITNIFYAILMLIVSIVSEPDDKILNWIITIATLPLTFVFNYFLSNLIFKNPSDHAKTNYTKQQIAMYIAAFYLFVSATLFYLKVHAVPGLETFTYLLFYFIIVVISLYQDKKTLINSSIAMFAILTIIHFFVTYNINTIIKNEHIEEITLVFVDIGLRSVIYFIFIASLYASVSISQYMQEQRKYELLRRKEVQGDFTEISADLFNVVLSSSKNLLKTDHANLVWKITKRMAQLLGYSEEKIDFLNQKSLIHLRYDEIKNTVSDSSDLLITQEYEKIRKQTELAGKISKRIQLAQKCEDIARAQTEGRINSDFIQDINRIQNNLDAQVILFSDLYVTMRDYNSYKRPKTHKEVLEIFEKTLNVFIKPEITDRFISFNKEFEKIYDNF